MSHKKVFYFRLFPFLVLLFAWVNIAAAAGPSNTVLINEIMYHPSAANAGAAYVELQNATDLTIDLSGWQFTKGIAFTFPANTILPARAYLVVASDSTAFARVYPTVANFIAGWTGNMGLDLRLEDSQGQVINEVSYAPDGDWATRQLGQPMYNHRGWEWVATHDGSGPSLELINATLPNTLAQNWTSSVSANGTPGRVNSTVNANLAPLISSVIHSPSLPGPSDPVTISARILDESAFGLTVDLLYRVASTSTPGFFTRVSMLDDGQHGDGLASDGIYGVVLPPRATGTIIEFYLEAKDAG
ncbi:MAG: hypothetical protein JWM04_849, partial [Verrucomicrobiales bacterium]|nr:hypothetical protein [Verrucomicrobiales bacterium]